MTAQAGTMQSTTEIRRAARGKRVLFRSLLVILKTSTSAVVFSFIVLFERHVHPLLLVFALLAATGLVAGLVSRSLLKGKHGLLQFLVALTAVFCGLIALNHYSGGVIGISYMTIYNGEFDAQAFIQSGIGILVMVLALSAWRKPTRRQQVQELSPTPRSFRSPELQLEEQQSAADRVRLSPARRAINWFTAQTPHPFVTGGGRRTPASPARGVVSLQGSNHRLRPGTRISTRRSTLLLKRKQPVKFMGAEEHRCPYCLEPVTANDPRGVEICQICHTHHHADCWEVTGVCQVPHANG